MYDFWAAMLSIRTKRRTLIPLLANNTQLYILSAIWAMRDRGLPVRIIELKGRQQGSSTGVAAFMFSEAVCIENTDCLVIADKNDKSRNVFQMYRRMYENFPPDVLPMCRYNKDGKRLVFENPDSKTRSENPGLKSRIECTQEQDVTSYTFHNIHISEAAMFRNFGAALDMMLQTVPAEPNTVVIIESTAKQAGDTFHNEWLRASEGKSGFYPLFIPWHVHEEYHLPFEDDSARETFEGKLEYKTDSRYGDEVGLLDAADDLTLEHLQWRRWCIDTNCRGSVAEFNRQYPTTPELAFMAVETNVFNNERLYWYLGNCTAAINGDMNWLRSTPEFMEDPHGPVYVWQPPEPGAEYIGGSDHSEGLDSGDFNVGVILRRQPLELVASLRGADGQRMTIPDFMELWVPLLHWYNEAWACPENNLDGGTAVHILKDEFRYRKLISEKMLQISRTERFGWRNSSATRKRAVSFLQEVVDNQEITIPWEKLVREMLNFVTVNRKPQAARKGEPRRPGDPEEGFYDDIIFALCGALLAHQYLPAPSGKAMWRRRESKFDRLRSPIFKSMPTQESWLNYV